MTHTTETFRALGRRHSSRYLTLVVFGLVAFGGLLTSCGEADAGDDDDASATDESSVPAVNEPAPDSGDSGETDNESILPPDSGETAETTIFAPLTRNGQTVAQVDLPRYLGKWYEIATFAQSFQRNCTGTTATYTTREDGNIGVLNECRVGSLDGRLKSINGFAKVADETTNAKLKVYFFQPFFGAPYWVIELDGREGDRPYEWAVVGSPSDRYLWILSRTPQVSDERLEAILTRLAERGYDLSGLSFTKQAPIE